MNRKTILGIALALSFAGCCLFALIGLGGYSAYQLRRSTPATPRLTEAFTTPQVTPEPLISLTPLATSLPGAGGDTLQTLEAATIPPSDLRQEAMRLKGIPNIPEVVSTASANYTLGTELSFDVSNQDTNQTFTVTAQLIYKTQNVYFFSEKGINVNVGDVQTLVDNFQNKTYPTDRNFFGSEWLPGVDGDPHLCILYVHGLGNSIAGYYSSADEYSKLAQLYSNEKEMFYINADVTSPGDSSLPGTLAHEFQHMIHWYHDRNAETWINEGASVLAQLLNGYGADGFDSDFLGQPDLQLDGWTEGGSGGDAIPHYGAGFLFMTYFLDRFGNQATQALVADQQANGLLAVGDVLHKQGLQDKVTGKPITAVDVFADWVIANYLGDPNVADGRYAYHLYKNAPKVSAPTQTFSDCPVATQSATVHQFATDYYEIDCSGKVTLSFTGSQQVKVIPTEPHSGRYAFWSHRNDESDTMLTRDFDLSGVSSATLNYWAWWALEQDYDFAYLEVSSDGGKTWKAIKTPSGTDQNPTGNNFGWGYTGNSGGGSASQWVEETVDLSAYAGKKIQIRFEYITDPAVTRAGFMLDDISIPEINYQTDFEKDDGGWQGVGFARIDNQLPQTFVVQVIHAGKQTTVQQMPLDANNTGRLTLELAPGEKAILVISGTTLFTREEASYQFEIET